MNATLLIDPCARRFSKAFVAALLCVAGVVVLGAAGPVRAQDPLLRFGGAIPVEVQSLYDRGLANLASTQNADGSWACAEGVGPGVTGICVMALMASGEDPNFGRYAANIRRGVRAMVESQDEKTGYLPSSMYHHGFAMLALAEAYGAVDEGMLWEGKKAPRTINQCLDLAIRCAATAQKKNRLGAWRYSPDSTDADTSVAGAVLMGLMAARNAGMDVPDETVQLAMEYLRRSTSPDGSVAYSGGFAGMGGSMNLTAISVLLGAVTKTKDSDAYKASLGRLTENLEHRENYHPEYFAYYAAQALFQGDFAAWEKWNGAKIRELQGSQNADGSFVSSGYQTGMALLALALNYRYLPVYER